MKQKRKTKSRLVGFHMDDLEQKKLDQAVKRNGGIQQAAILRMAFHQWDQIDRERHKQKESVCL